MNTEIALFLKRPCSGAITRRDHCLSVSDHRCAAAGIPTWHLGVTGSRGRQSFFPKRNRLPPEHLRADCLSFWRAPLTFANATSLEEEIQNLVTQAATPVKWLVLDAEAMIDIDTTGAEVLHKVLTWLADRGVTVVLSRANQPASALLAQYHLLELIGADRLYPTNRHAVAAFRRVTGQA